MGFSCGRSIFCFLAFAVCARGMWLSNSRQIRPEHSTPALEVLDGVKGLKIEAEHVLDHIQDLREHARNSSGLAGAAQISNLTMLPHSRWNSNLSMLSSPRPEFPTGHGHAANGTLLLHQVPVAPPVSISAGRAAIFFRDLLNKLVNRQPPTTPPPLGVAIWDDSENFPSFITWHPAGVRSNIWHGGIKWANVNYINLPVLLFLSLVGYPVLPVAIFIIFMIIVSMSLPSFRDPTQETINSPWTCSSVSVYKDFEGIQQTEFNALSSFGKGIYTAWTWFCRMMPLIMVAGMPAVLAFFSWPYPEEVVSALGGLTSLIILNSGLHMLVFGGKMAKEIHRVVSIPAEERRALPDLADYPIKDVIHWVMIPQFGEHVDVVSRTLESIGKSSVAKSSINILMAMEEREQEARLKASILQDRFAGSFKEMLVTYHPSGLPNDPPGKASNLCYGFKQLCHHLETRNDDHSNVVLTVADADSEFHELYFEILAKGFLRNYKTRDHTIWQSPIMHTKNYHRQPCLVCVGTIFQAITEMSMLADPNGVRFPYSTYSLSISLAKQVGGWDPEWIAEDYHMGIKCYLLTLGKVCIESIPVPTLNYTPETDGQGFWEACMARWVQAKRHALGFSDFSYFFLTIPLIFCQVVSSMNKKGSTINKLSEFWYMMFRGISVLVRLINVHCFLGTLFTYTVFQFVLRVLMHILMGEKRQINMLLERTMGWQIFVVGLSSICIMAITGVFQYVYFLTKNSMEPPAENKAWLYRNRFAHWLYTCLGFLFLGIIYFFALGVATWRAAIYVILNQSLEYEVAAKPTGHSGHKDVDVTH